MTNLDRAAAIAAERGWRRGGEYRGWVMYRADPGWIWAVHPHEITPEQAIPILTAAFPEDDNEGYYDGFTDDTDCMGIYSMEFIESATDMIDRWEAAREAMPATAFFGVPEEVAL